MIINGVTLQDIDIMDAEAAENYESALDEVATTIAAIDTKNQPRSVVIRTECRVVFNLFNQIFGAGTDKKVFGDKVNLSTTMDAYLQLIKEVNRLDNQAAAKFKEIPTRFQNNQNSQLHKNKHQYYNHSNKKHR